MKAFKTLGHCQCCGRIQAVVAGNKMSKHGYTVDNGWFNGVCNGKSYEPMELSTEHTKAVVRVILEECDNLEAKAADYESGKFVPAFVTTLSRKTITWAEANQSQREREVELAVYNLRNRAKHGRAFAEQLTTLADRVHGQPLQQEAKPEPTEPILRGEVRKLANGNPVTVVSVEGARVYWKNERGFKGWTGTRAFRLLEKV